MTFPAPPVANPERESMSYRVILNMHGATVGFGFALALLSSFGQSFFIALFVPDIQRDFELSHAAVGAVFSSATLASGMLMIYAGALLDRVSVRTYAAFGLVGLSCACFAMSIAGGIASLAITIFALRLFGQGMLTHAAVTNTARLPEAIRGRAVGFATLGFPIGAGLTPTLGIALITTFGWIETWRIAGSLLLGCILVMLMMPRTGIMEPKSVVTTAERSESIEAPKMLRRLDLLRDWRFWVLMPTVIGSPAISTGFLFEQRFLAEERGWGLGMLAIGMTTYAVTSVVGAIAGGSAVDRIGVGRVARMFLLPMAGASALMATVTGLLVAPLFFAGVGMTVGASQVVITAALANLYGTAQLGMIRAVAAAIMVIASALTPALFGALIDAGIGFASIGAACALYLVAASALNLLLRSTDKSR